MNIQIARPSPRHRESIGIVELHSTKATNAEVVRIALPNMASGSAWMPNRMKTGISVKNNAGMKPKNAAAVGIRAAERSASSATTPPKMKKAPRGMCQVGVSPSRVTPIRIPKNGETELKTAARETPEASDARVIEYFARRQRRRARQAKPADGRPEGTRFDTANPENE